ncbi:MAG: cytochrome c-type biogenesis protein CcmH [Minicystis sp.]
MTDRRTFLRALLVVPTAALAVGVTRPAFAQGMPEGMERAGGIRIKNDEERRIFTDLLCMCGGCTREALNTCTCGFADKYRSEVRAMMAEGLTAEQIRAEWVRQYGPQALSVPPNQGANRLIYIAPLVAVVGMAAFVVTLLRRFRRRDEEKQAVAGVAPPVAGSKRDEYDDKLDEELKQLDDE